jgi:hypothetical protein
VSEAVRQSRGAWKMAGTVLRLQWWDYMSQTTDGNSQVLLPPSHADIGLGIGNLASCRM